MGSGYSEWTLMAVRSKSNECRAHLAKRPEPTWLIACRTRLVRFRLLWSELPRPNMPSLSLARVLYEDNHLLVLNKPAGLPTMGTPEGTPTLLTLAKEYIKQKYQKPGNVYLGVVSRLDAPVSGVNPRAADLQGRRTAERTVSHPGRAEDLLGVG